MTRLRWIERATLDQRHAIGALSLIFKSRRNDWQRQNILKIQRAIEAWETGLAQAGAHERLLPNCWTFGHSLQLQGF